MSRPIPRALTMLLALGLALFLAGPASAQAFSRADTDRSGTVSYAEAERLLRWLSPSMFRSCDLDGTGELGQAGWACLTNLYRTMTRDF
jgi:hypothetical protein